MPSLNERLLAARTEPAIKKSNKRTAAVRSTAAKKRKTVLEASEPLEDPKEPVTLQLDEEEYRTDDVPASKAVHELVEPEASQSDEEDCSADEDFLSPDLEVPAEPVPQSEGKDYDTDDDLYCASDSDSGLQEEEQIIRSEFEVQWRIENYRCDRDGEFKCLHHIVANLRDCRLREIEFRTDYDNGEEDGRKGMRAFTYGDQENYFDALYQLIHWRALGHRGLKLSLIARVKKMPSTAAPLAQRVRVPDLRMQLGTGGHPVAKTRRQWTCKRQDCDRFGLTCWWGVKDLPKYHVPIRACHLRAWGCGMVDDGKPTPQDPGAALVQRMMRYQHALTIANAPAPPVQVNIYNYGSASIFHQTIQANGVNINISHFGPEGHLVGGYRMPGESQSLADEQFDQFKAWCLDSPSWNGERSQVEMITSTLEWHDHSVEDVAYMDAAGWNACGLDEAYRMKMNWTAETWIISQGAQRRICQKM